MSLTSKQLLIAFSTLFIKYFLITNLGITCSYSYGLDKNPPAKAPASDLTKAQPEKKIDIEAIINQIFVNWPPFVISAIKFLIKLHQQKCAYDDVITEYHAKNNPAPNPPLSSTVDKIGGASARARSGSIDLVPTKTPEKIREFSELLSSKAKSVGSGIRENWRDGLRRVQSFTPAKSKLSQEIKIPEGTGDHTQADSHSHTGAAHARGAATRSYLDQHNTRVATTTAQLATHTTNLTSAAPPPTGSSAAEIAERARYFRAKGPDLSRAEQEALQQPENELHDLVYLARQIDPFSRFVKPPPLVEILPSAHGPFIYGADQSTTDNMAFYKQYHKTAIDIHLSRQAEIDRIRHHMVFNYDQEDETTRLLDLFSGVKPKNYLKDYLKRATASSTTKSTHKSNDYWLPPQDYYCTNLYKDKIVRKPNIQL